jgi:hypothetical protein
MKIKDFHYIWINISDNFDNLLFSIRMDYLKRLVIVLAAHKVKALIRIFLHVMRHLAAFQLVNLCLYLVTTLILEDEVLL